MAEILVVLFIVFLWAFAFRVVEWRAMFDWLYFVVVTMATIWYWDFVPVTAAWKWLTMLYAVMWVPLFVYTTSIFLDYRFKRYIKKYAKLMKHESENKNEITNISWFTKMFGKKHAVAVEEVANDENLDSEEWSVKQNNTESID